MARVRSPNYPQLSLEDAITRVAQVFAKEHKHATPKEVVIKHLGYGSLNGASLGAISALSKYGLLEREGDQYRVTERAIAILHPASEAERAEALREAATAPALFSEILDHYQGVLPSDDNLRAYLIRRGFAQSAVPNVIQTLRDTMQLIGPAVPQYSPPEQPRGVESKMQTMQPRASAAMPAQTSSPNLPPGKEFRVSLTDDSLQIVADLADQRGVDRLIAILQANKVLLPLSRDIDWNSGVNQAESDIDEDEDRA